MVIYFACSITGGRADEAAYQLIVSTLETAGHEVPTAHLARPEVMDLEGVVDPADVYRRDIAWIDGCDALVAEVSTPSHGVGYEIGYALHIGKPVLCCYRQGVRVSKMITGNPDARLQCIRYHQPDDLRRVLRAFLSRVRSGGH